MSVLYEKKNANAPRLLKDQLFVDFGTRYALKGETDRLIRFMERVQLKDAALWALVVNQFRSNVDDHDKGWRCEYFGKLMRGGCFVWSYTRDEALLETLTAAVKDMLTTQDALGRFSTYSTQAEFDGWDLWGRKYVLLGFQYFLEICADEALKAQLVAAMVAHADYILAHIGPGKLEITKASNFWKGLNSATILEPMVRLYTITGESRYLDFARYVVESGGIETGDLIALALENKLMPSQYPVTKAYEMMSFFEGVLEYYRITGEEKYRRAVENFAEAVAEHEISVIGCAGCTHELFDHTAKRQTDSANMIIMQETCVTVTWMKLCFQLLCLDGESRHADRIELSAYNALFGAVNTEGVTKNNGFPFDSYSPLLPNKRGRGTGGFKVMEDGKTYGCCVAIGACGLGLVPKATCLTRKDGLALSLYADGEIETKLADGTAVKLIITGGYPVNGDICVNVYPEKDTEFVLAVRIPGWSEQTALTVNGEAISAESGTYVEIARAWRSGDTVRLTLDMRTRQQVQEGFVSFRRGPLVLARDARLGEDVFGDARVLLEEDGSVQTAPSQTATFPVLLEQKLLQPYGGQFTVIDYASAGKTWDYDSLTAAWMPRHGG